eukprot:gene34703-42804_t
MCPWGDTQGNMYIGDYGIHKIRLLSKSTGLMNTVAGVTGQSGFNQDGPATSAYLNNPYQLYGDTPNNNLYIADNNNHRLRVLNWNTGIITTIAGTGSPSSTGDNTKASSANIASPSGVFKDISGTIYFAENGLGNVRQISTSGIITTVISSLTNGLMQIWADSLNYMYVCNNNAHNIVRMHKTTLATTIIDLSPYGSLGGNNGNAQGVYGNSAGFMIFSVYYNSQIWSMGRRVVAWRERLSEYSRHGSERRRR